jgi:uncharacterized membrane protein YhaH (DUF805 family)
MSKASDIYSYKPGKSANEEVHLLNGKGRITLLMFWERLLVIGSLTLFVNLILEMLMEGEEPLFTYAFNGTQYDGMYTIQWLTYLLFAFALNVQAIKRAHDCNMTGVLGMINPIIYFKRGSIGDNDHGKDPFPLPKVQYFDEYEELKDKNEFQVRRKYIRTIPAFFACFALLIYATDSYYSDNRTTPDYEPTTNGLIDTNVYSVDSMSISDETIKENVIDKKKNSRFR